MDALLAAAAAAPAAPGVYFMLDGARELVYIGKAGNLRRRLQQHAKAAATGASYGDVRRGATVADVRWEVVATEADAADREADLVVALAPRLNGSLAADARWTFVDVRTAGGTATIAQTRDEASRPQGTRYGCFPHLGPGGASRRADACTSGLAALVRLMWAAAASSDDRPTRAITGASLPMDAVTVPMSPSTRPAVARFFNGTSARVVDDLLSAALDRRPVLERARLERDADAARQLFVHGPAAMRDLRRRAGLPRGPVTAGQVRDALTAQVAEIVGPFRTVGSGAELAPLVGKRTARALSLRARRATSGRGPSSAASRS